MTKVYHLCCWSWTSWLQGLLFHCLDLVEGALEGALLARCLSSLMVSFEALWHWLTSTRRSFSFVKGRCSFEETAFSCCNKFWSSCCCSSPFLLPSLVSKEEAFTRASSKSVLWLCVRAPLGSHLHCQYGSHLVNPERPGWFISSFLRRKWYNQGWFFKADLPAIRHPRGKNIGIQFFGPCWWES